MINLLMFGPPGAGKGTQAQLLAAQFRLRHLSTGDIFRSEMGQGTELGRAARTYIEKGMLVPDEITVGMLRGYLKPDPAFRGFILDGFPRTIAQAEALDRLLGEWDSGITRVFSLEVPDEELKKRLRQRALTSGRSDDADENVIEHRLEVYRKETLPLKAYYARQGLLEEVKGVGSIEEIFSDICNRIRQLGI
ncbi:MAG: adenylate kinase [Flavobacteriales bacterium]|nr:adenylate kinase [Flavobacteriales bacterium]MCX7768099.1 adenylate kinase [Flavobacteriales bacterium]MDW8409608.1 adenylate kinase [Flavobacteriales bacterium]